ncbi:hypothetical protein AB0H51_21315 [Streptomyces griseoluteus]|uniref:hypothetical protein n=1 Tax=Streptomyces griseoluteus TaxID=29306 RepID=UPI0033DAC405
MNPDGSISIKWWLPDGLGKEVLKSIKATLRDFENADLTCGACESEIEIHHGVLLAVQLVRKDRGFDIFLTHPLCAAPRVRVAPEDVAFAQGENATVLHYQAALTSTGEALLLLDIAPFFRGVPERHRNVFSATRLYAEAHGFGFSLNTSLMHLAVTHCAKTRLVIRGNRAFITREGVGILDELDLSAASVQWRGVVARTGTLSVVACVGLLRIGAPDPAVRMPAVAYAKLEVEVSDSSDLISPVKEKDDSIYKVLKIAPEVHPTVFMLDSDVIVCIDRWFYGSGKPHSEVMRRQLTGLLTIRNLIGPLHIDYVLGVAENCWGRFSGQVNKHRARKILRAVNTVLSMDTGALMELMNQEGRPARIVRPTDRFPVEMPRKEADLQTMSYALALRLQLLYRQSRGSNTERKLRLLEDYIEELGREVGFVGVYEFQIACDLLFSGREARNYVELLLKPHKERKPLESSWGAAWDITHMRRADLALRGNHTDVPEFAALVTGDRALRALRERLSVYRPVEVRGVKTLQMRLTPPKFNSDRDTARFAEIVQRVHGIVDSNLRVSAEVNVEKARRQISKLEALLTK